MASPASASAASAGRCVRQAARAPSSKLRLPYLQEHIAMGMPAARSQQSGLIVHMPWILHLNPWRGPPLMSSLACRHFLTASVSMVCCHILRRRVCPRASRPASQSISAASNRSTSSTTSPIVDTDVSELSLNICLLHHSSPTRLLAGPDQNA